MAVAALAATALVLLMSGGPPPVVPVPQPVKLEPPPEPAPVRHTVVEGESTLRLRPDMARLVLVVTEEAPAGQMAMELGLRVTHQVEATLKEEGIAADDVQRVFGSLSERADPFRGWYRVGYEVHAQVRDISQVDSLVTAALAAGARQVGSVTYGLQNTDQARQEVLKAALKNALDQAQTVASAAGVRFRDLVRIEANLIPETAGSSAASLKQGEPPAVLFRAQARVTFAH